MKPTAGEIHIYNPGAMVSFLFLFSFGIPLPFVLSLRTAHWDNVDKDRLVARGRGVTKERHPDRGGAKHR